MHKISTSLKRTFIILLAIYLLSVTTLVYLFTRGNRIAHAILGMGLGLILLWIVVGGLGMYISAIGSGPSSRGFQDTGR